MGFAKYFEDNMEAIEERIMLRTMKEELPPPIVCITPRQSQTISVTLINEPEIIPQKKTKRKTKKLVCCECGTSFLFTGGEQHYYEKHKLSEPKRCSCCREKRRVFFKRQCA